MRYITIWIAWSGDVFYSRPPSYVIVTDKWIKQKARKWFAGQSVEIVTHTYGEVLHLEWIGKEDCGFLVFVIVIQTIIM